MKSALQIARAAYQPRLPKIFQNSVDIKFGRATTSVADNEEIKKLFPNTYGIPVVSFEESKSKKEYSTRNVGVILSGGQAPGGHNVISGLFDGMKKLNPNSILYGFLGGPSGLIDHKYLELTADVIDEYRNTGGFDIIGSGRTKLETIEQFERGREICQKLNIGAIVIIGGDDSNTNACILAEYYKSKGYGIQVIGCPKTIDGDLKNDMIETSFGFDTACKVYSELIGNIQRDANSAKKYWHFIRLMGRSASHITLECALQTQPNIAIISEDVAAKGMRLQQIVDSIAQVIVARGNAGLNFGTILIPEGLIEFIPDVKMLVEELNDILAHNHRFEAIKDEDDRRWFINEHLSLNGKAIFNGLPVSIANQLSADRDSHGNVQVSLIETEKLLMAMVDAQLLRLKQEGVYKGKFSPLGHFFGYEGRCAAPTNFDADYCYSLGYTASVLINEGVTGYMAVVQNLALNVDSWIAGGVPITKMMNMEKKSGKMKPVIQKALVDLEGNPFKYFAAHCKEWASTGCSFVYPGPIQYFGPDEVCNVPTKTIRLENNISC